MKSYIWSIVLYGAENVYTLESRPEILWNDLNVAPKKDGEDQRGRSCEKLRNIKKGQRNELPTYNTRKAKWICHSFHKNFLSKHVVEYKIKGRENDEKRRQQPLSDLKENRRYWNMKDEELDHTAWRTHFRRGRGYVGRETTQ